MWICELSKDMLHTFLACWLLTSLSPEAVAKILLCCVLFVWVYASHITCLCLCPPRADRNKLILAAVVGLYMKWHSIICVRTDQTPEFPNQPTAFPTLYEIFQYMVRSKSKFWQVLARTLKSGKLCVCMNSMGQSGFPTVALTFPSCMGLCFLALGRQLPVWQACPLYSPRR